MTSTSDIVSQVIALSVNRVAEQSKESLYRMICNSLNGVMQSEKALLSAGYNFVYSAWIETGGYAVLPVDTVVQATAVLYRANGYSKALNRLNFSTFIERTANKSTAESAEPAVWTWSELTNGVLVYPLPKTACEFAIASTVGPPKITVTLTDNIFEFSPTGIDFGEDVAFSQYAILSVAKEICLFLNSAFNSDKMERLAELKSKLHNKKEGVKIKFHSMPTAISNRQCRY